MSDIVWLELPNGLTKCEIRKGDADIIRSLDRLINDLNNQDLRLLAKKAHIIKMNLCDDIVKRDDYV